MGASIRWKPSDQTSNSLDVGMPSNFAKVMRNAGLELPITITRVHVGMLRGMAAFFNSDILDRNDENPYQKLIDLLENYESIDLWAEY